MATSAEAAYQSASNQEGRIKDLVIDNLGLVRRIANRLHTNLDPSIAEEDLIGAGVLGLVQAAHRFDGTRGVKFSTFAYERIKGAVIDFLRDNDLLGKAARERLARLRQSAARLHGLKGRKPTIEELAHDAGMSEQEVLKALSYEKWDTMGSLQAEEPGADSQSNVLAELIPAQTDTPLEELERKERVERLSRAIESLPEREKQIIIMYYYEELYMSEMAAILNVTEGRISQLHTRAIYNLTRKLEEL